MQIAPCSRDSPATIICPDEGSSGTGARARDGAARRSGACCRARRHRPTASEARRRRRDLHPQAAGRAVLPDARALALARRHDDHLRRRLHRRARLRPCAARPRRKAPALRRRPVLHDALDDPCARPRARERQRTADHRPAGDTDERDLRRGPRGDARQLDHRRGPAHRRARREWRPRRRWDGGAHLDHGQHGHRRPPRRDLRLRTHHPPRRGEHGRSRPPKRHRGVRRRPRPARAGRARPRQHGA